MIPTYANLQSTQKFSRRLVQMLIVILMMMQQVLLPVRELITSSHSVDNLYQVNLFMYLLLKFSEKFVDSKYTLLVGQYMDELMNYG